MGTRTTVMVRLLGIALLITVSLTAGCAGLGLRSESADVSSGVVAPAAPETAVKSDETGDVGAVAAPDAYGAGGEPVRTAQDALVISTAGMGVEVKALDKAVAAIRTLATKYGATISNLSMSAGSGSVPTPAVLDDPSVQYAVPSPGGATVTLRIPSDKLAAAQGEIASLGRVISQTSSQDDVTQQHVDMKARLKNLQAEESRLRTFFLKAKSVSDMLAIEQELARVRGEIESMQAQIVYLERQAALATLTVSLSEPGTLVSPAEGGWGFSAAIRDGVRAAAAVLRGLITTLLAFSPIIALGLVLFALIRALVLRRRKRRAARTPAPDDQSDASEYGTPEPPAGQ